jgi:DNA-binding NarL/FixJ family response regulator
MTVSPHRILCIEDDERLRRLLVEDLSEAGYDVRTASDARTGQREFFNHAPALVLCDVRMPRVSGFELIERLRRLDPLLFGAAFIFLTALADRENHLRGRRLGADDYITKPVDYEILREVVRIRLAGRDPIPPTGPLDSCLGDALDVWFDGYQSGAEAPGSHPLKERFRIAGRTHTQSDPRLFEAIANGLPLGVLIIDRAGILRYVNESAAELLGHPRPNLTGSRASPCLLEFARTHAASERAKNGGFSAARIVVSADGKPSTAVARTMRGDVREIGASIAIILPRLSASSAPFSGLLRTLFDLTPAEELVATQVGAGTNLSDVAEHRGVAVATVRSQLKTVFDKMGVTRQSDLVRALMSLQLAIGFTEV